jgi:hypothetical protein
VHLGAGSLEETGYIFLSEVQLHEVNYPAASRGASGGPTPGAAAASREVSDLKRMKVR